MRPNNLTTLPFAAMLLCATAILPQGALADEIQPLLDTSKCVDVTDMSDEDGALVQLWTCAGTKNQKWTRDGSLMRVFGDQCLDVKDGDDADGTPVQIWTCDNANPHQQWQRDGRLIRWANTDKCLHVYRGQAANGAKLQIRTCDKTTTRQSFRLLTDASSQSTAAPSTSSGSSSATKPSSPAPTTTTPASTNSGTFLGFNYISLDAFITKHPVLKNIRQDIIDAGNSGSPTKLPPILLAAIAMEESSGNPKVKGGLMQFTWAPTWAAYGKGDINNARDSLFAATRYLNDLLKSNKNDLSKALREYNGDANAQYVAQIKSWLTGGFPYGQGT